MYINFEEIEFSIPYVEDLLSELNVKINTNHI